MFTQRAAASYDGPREIHYLFVDGASLRGRLQNLSMRFFGDQKFDINFPKLAAGFTKVFYYDAIPVRNEGEVEQDYDQRIRPQRDLLAAAASTDGIHVYEGNARKRGRKAGLEQKMVDVMIAVD